MNKKILIIGTPAGNLPGTQVDINGYTNFFTSPEGGIIGIVKKLNN